MRNYFLEKLQSRQSLTDTGLGGLYENRDIPKNPLDLINQDFLFESLGPAKNIEQKWGGDWGKENKCEEKLALKRRESLDYLELTIIKKMEEWRGKRMKRGSGRRRMEGF